MSRKTTENHHVVEYYEYLCLYEIMTDERNQRVYQVERQEPSILQIKIKSRFVMFDYLHTLNYTPFLKLI